MRNKIITLTTEDLTSGTVSSAEAGSNNSGNTTLSSGGTYDGQEFSAVYTITALNNTTYTLTCDYGADRDLSTSGTVSFGSPISIGTVGVTATFTDVLGSGTVTADDSWTIDCAGSKKIVDCKMSDTITSADSQNSRIQYRFPRRIAFSNGTGKEISFNVLSNDTELDDFISDSTNFALIPVADSDELEYNDIYPLPTPEYLVIQKSETGSPSADLEIKLLTYYPRSSR